MATLLALTGCVTTWQPQLVAPAQLLETTGASEVRVTLSSGAKVILRDPGLENDSLVGWVAPSHAAKEGQIRRAFALGEVRDVAVKKNDSSANILLGVAAGTALFFGTVLSYWYIACATSYCD